MLWSAVLARKGNKRQWVWPSFSFTQRLFFSFIPEKVKHKVTEILQRAQMTLRRSSSGNSRGIIEAQGKGTASILLFQKQTEGNLGYLCKRLGRAEFGNCIVDHEALPGTTKAWRVLVLTHIGLKRWFLGWQLEF